MSDKQKGDKNAWKRGIYSKAVLKNEKKLKIDLNSLDQELWLAKILLRRIVVGETLHNQQLQDQAAQNPDEGVTPVYNPIYNKFINRLLRQIGRLSEIRNNITYREDPEKISIEIREFCKMAEKTIPSTDNDDILC